MTDVDIADVVSIDKMEVEVYDQTRHADIYPARGSKLNMPAKITFYNVKPYEKINAPLEKKIKFL